MSKNDRPAAYSDRTSRSFDGGHSYTFRHPSDRRFRLWHLVPLAAMIGLVWWGLA